MKRILILMALLLAFTFLPDAARAQEKGNGWHLVMEKHNLRDANIGAADSLHRSDRGFGKFISLNDAMIDSLSLVLRVSDSLGRGRLIIERPGVNGVIDTVGLELDSITSDVGTWLVVSWFQLNKAMGGLGVMPQFIDFHYMLRSKGTTFAGAPQVSTEMFDIWLKEHRKKN